MAASSSASVKELEDELKDAGKMLMMLPSSTDDLLHLLDKVEHLLSKVGQAPSTSMQDALLPSMKALIDDELMRHSDMNVKVYVASCFSELTRITAPDAPYDDELMKEIFQLTLMAFEKLSCVSGPCYSKAIQILNSMSTVKSCLIMLDLECDTLIVKMFQQFINTIRSNHPHAVFSDMETIMTMVIEESDQISLELLSFLLASVKKENQSASPLGWKLGERVLENCAARLKSHLPEAVKSLNLTFDDCADIVASICQYVPGSNHVKYQVAEELVPAPDAICPEEIRPPMDRLSKSFMSDCPALKTLEHCNQSMQESVGTKTLQEENHPLPDPKRRGRKPNSLITLEEGHDRSWVKRGKNSPGLPRPKKNHEKQTGCSPKSSALKKSASPLEPEYETKPLDFSMRVSCCEGRSASPHSFPDEDNPKRVQPRNQNVENLVGGLDSVLALEGDMAKVQVQRKTLQSAGYEKIRDSKTKSRGGSRKNKIVTRTRVEKIPLLSHVVVKKENEFPCDSEGKEELLIQEIEAKKWRRGNTISVKHAIEDSGNKTTLSTSATKSSSKNEKVLDEVSKKKRGLKKPGEELVGCRIKVWWPLDQVFYEGAISSFDYLSKKHKVLYADGDEEILNLSKERWELISLNQEQETKLPSLSSFSDKLQKKNAKTRPESSKKKETSLFSSKSGGICAAKSKMEASNDGQSRDGLTVANKLKDNVTQTDGSSKDHGEQFGYKRRTKTGATLKLKCDTSRIVTKSKGKISKVHSESYTNSTVAEKHGVSQEKVNGDAHKEILPVSSDAQENVTKSGKKRQRWNKS